MCQRALMTWSFDGLLPRRFAAVTPTRHTPAAAIVATALLSVPLAVWICYSDNFFQYFAIAAVSAYPSLVLVGITATIIKRRRPDLYKGSSAEWRLAGIEVLPVFGVLCSLVGAAAIALLFIYHKEVGLQYTTETAIYLVAMFVDRGDLVGGGALHAPGPGHRPLARVQGDPARMRLGRRRTRALGAHLLRHRRARVGAVLPEVPQHGQVLRRAVPDPRWGHHGQDPRPIERRSAGWRARSTSTSTTT